MIIPTPAVAFKEVGGFKADPSSLLLTPDPPDPLDEEVVICGVTELPVTTLGEALAWGLGRDPPPLPLRGEALL